MPKLNPIEDKNAALLQAIEDAGYANVKAFAKTHGLNYPNLLRIINRIVTPRKKRAASIARKLGKTVEELGLDS